MTFYMTYYRSRAGEIVPYCEKHNVGTMLNASSRWSDAKQDFLDLWVYDAPQIIDSGGYNVQVEYGTQYPWSIDQYHEWLTKNKDHFEWAACMDFACEERFDEMWSVDDRVRATLRNTVDHFDRDPDYKLLPVLQGRTLDDYVWFYEQLRDYGIPTEYVGLGTVCRLSNTKEIVEIEQGLRARTKIDKIHGFGVKVDAFKHGAYFESADSQAWAYYPSNGKVVYDDGDSLRKEPCDDAKKRSIQSFINYYQYASRLKEKAKEKRGRDGEQAGMQRFTQGIIGQAD